MHEIIHAIDERQPEIAALTEDLVRIPTENPPGSHVRDCVERIGVEFRTLGLEYQIHEVPESPMDAPRVWLESFVGEGTKTLYFHGHCDVVPAADETQFVPRRSGDRLFGRGSSDMKSGLAAMIYAARALLEHGKLRDGRIGITIVADEETGGKWGSAHLARNGLLGRDAIGVLIPEPTSGVIWNACRGALSAR